CCSKKFSPSHEDQPKSRLFDPQLSPDDRPLVTLFCEQATRTDVGPNVEYLDTTPFSNYAAV
ncbi:MAG: hypothetical protein DMF26_12450, partial [Verrucomicrobia bacterium]